jgi:hypothetical protein
MMEEPHIVAHKSSIFHRAQIMASELCGCFYCLEIFKPSDIERWTDINKDESQYTALCPHCGIDAVIGSASGYPITKEFLKRMEEEWF